MRDGEGGEIEVKYKRQCRCSLSNVGFLAVNSKGRKKTKLSCKISKIINTFNGLVGSVDGRLMWGRGQL